MPSNPIVMVSSYPPRLCGIGTFTEEAREFIQKSNPDRDVLVVSHTDGQGEGVFPLVDMTRSDWWRPVADKIKEISPYAVHLEHEYGLYEFRDKRGIGDNNAGFLTLLEAISSYPIVVEPHTIHGRMRDAEAEFVYKLCQRSDVVLFKCHYQKWRLDWNFSDRGWSSPRNIMVVPHGARPDKRWGADAVPALRKELNLDKKALAERVVGMIGWIQSNKRWDIVLSIWDEVHEKIKRQTGQKWDLLAAGAMRDPNDMSRYANWRSDALELQDQGIAHYREFIPRGDLYYKTMAICDFIVLPSIDETQSGTLARIIALNKPYITSAPMEGLTAQTIESKGGLMFTTKQMLKEGMIRLACDEDLRFELGERLKTYLDDVVSWDVVVQQYEQSYRLAREVKSSGHRLELPPEF